MDQDDQLETASTLEMTVSLVSVSIRVNTAGDVKYRLAFEYPQGYDEYLKQLLVGAADLYWNGHLFAQSATVGALRAKPVKDQPPQFLVSFDCDGGDVARFNMSAQAATPGGSLRISSTQLVMFPR